MCYQGGDNIRYQVPADIVDDGFTENITLGGVGTSAKSSAVIDAPARREAPEAGEDNATPAGNRNA